MLTLTPDATAAVARIRSQRGLPDEYGLRLYTSANADGRRSIQVQLVDAPIEGDEVAASNGANVFVAPELSDALDGRVLDATTEGAETRLVLQRT
jgi:Fe-S cluster assembly iron-binding protein IscA